MKRSALPAAYLGRCVARAEACIALGATLEEVEQHEDFLDFLANTGSGLVRAFIHPHSFEF